MDSYTSTYFFVLKFNTWPYFWKKKNWRLDQHLTFLDYKVKSHGKLINLSYFVLILDNVSFDLVSVSAAESTEVALSLLQARKNYFNMVIADLELPEGGIFVVVDKCRQMNIPLICELDQLTIITNDFECYIISLLCL